jgi:hypothetical protein
MAALPIKFENPPTIYDIYIDWGIVISGRSDNNLGI